jgi:hypothetical protein
MDGKETKDEGSNPEQASEAAPVIVHSENETQSGQYRIKIAYGLCAIWNWLKGFLEPSTFVVLLLFLATLALYKATSDLVHDAQRAAELQLRAWIAPIGIVLTTPVKEGEKIRYTLSYQNTGHSPAEHVTFYGDQTGVTDTPVEQFTLAPDPTSRGWIGNTTCDPAIRQQLIHNWPAVYPSIQTPHTYDLESDVIASADIITGVVAKLTQGCFVYNTLTLKQRVSQYCFYLQPGEWKFHRCAYGNDAD